MTFRVDEPPAAVPLLRAKHSGRPELRTRSPAAKSIRPRDRRLRIGPQIILLCFRPRLELVERMHLARPIRMRILAELVHEREELVVDRKRKATPLAVRFYTLYVKLRVLFLAVAKDDKLMNGAAGVDAMGESFGIVAYHSVNIAAARRKRQRLMDRSRSQNFRLLRLEAKTQGRMPCVIPATDPIKAKTQCAIRPI